jgi:predicted alpha/beta hydrolase
MRELPTRAADGHEFTTRWFAAGEAAGRAASGLLFLPALGVAAAKYDRFAAALAAHGIGVAVPDWRGLGTSSLRPSRARDWGYPELVDRDVVAAADVVADVAPGLRWWIGGHSLGGQVAVLHAARQPGRYGGLALVATGLPDWRLYGGRRWGVRLFAAAIPPVTRLVGHFPGRHLRWAGTEAATLMRQWASTVRRGDYDAVGLDGVRAQLAALALPAATITFADDWLASPESMEALLDTTGGDESSHDPFDAARLGDAADHFRWLKSPGAPAAVLAARIDAFSP